MCERGGGEVFTKSKQEHRHAASCFYPNGVTPYIDQQDVTHKTHIFTPCSMKAAKYSRLHSGHKQMSGLDKSVSLHLCGRDFWGLSINYVSFSETCH